MSHVSTCHACLVLLQFLHTTQFSNTPHTNPTVAYYLNCQNSDCFRLFAWVMCNFITISVLHDLVTLARHDDKVHMSGQYLHHLIRVQNVHNNRRHIIPRYQMLSTLHCFCYSTIFITVLFFYSTIFITFQFGYCFFFSFSY